MHEALSARGVKVEVFCSGKGVIAAYEGQVEGQKRNKVCGDVLAGSGLESAIDSSERAKLVGWNVADDLSQEFWWKCSEFQLYNLRWHSLWSENVYLRFGAVLLFSLSGFRNGRADERAKREVDEKWV